MPITSEPSQVESPKPPLAPAPGEAWLILGLPVLIFTAGGLFQLGGGRASNLDSYGVVSLVAFELILAAWTVFWLSHRDWTWRTVTTGPRRSDTGHALGLYVVSMLLFEATTRLQVVLVQVPTYDPGAGQAHLVFHPLAVVLLSIVNPVFEEGLWLGYIFHGPCRGNPRQAMVLSVVARTLIHLTQGWTALFGILPTGLLFAAYYRRYGRLLPLILVHAAMDAVALGRYIG